MTRRSVVWLLAGLWVVDGLLQLQPGMFTMAMIQAVLQPAVQGQPWWLADLMHWLIRVLSWNLPLFNAIIAAIQLAIGAALVWRGNSRTWPFWASLAWSALLWVGGQGLGSLLTGEASLLTGAPGSAVLYALLTWAAWPAPPQGDRGWEVRRRARVGLVLGSIWALGAFLQSAPGFGAPSGLAGLIAANADGQPTWLADLLGWGASGLRVAPALTNSMAVTLMALTAAGIWVGGRLLRPALVLSGIVTAWAWMFGQAFGMIFTGMATDPNSAPLYAALAAYVWGGRAASLSRRPKPSAPAEMERENAASPDAPTAPITAT